MHDVAIHSESVDLPVARTCRIAFEREGWLVRSSGEALVHVLIWSENSVTSRRLADVAREPLEAGKLLQLLVQPAGSPSGTSGIEAPAPYCFFQGLLLQQQFADGSDYCINHFWQDFEGSRVLGEVARLGGLSRPFHTWNAVVELFSGENGMPLTVDEYDSPGGRLLRRLNIDWTDFLQERLGTTLGNVWRATLDRTVQVIGEVTIENPTTRIWLPGRPPWWRRLGLGTAQPPLALHIRTSNEPAKLVSVTEGMDLPAVHPLTRADVFISYGREDKKVAQRLDTLCANEGWTVWWDPQIGVGADFRPEIDKAISEAKCVVVIWSRHSAASEWVRYETGAAAHSGKLVEVKLREDLAEHAIRVSDLTRTDPAAEELLDRIAQVGGLHRQHEEWDTTLMMTYAGDQPPTDPIIALEWLPSPNAQLAYVNREFAGENYRLARRMRWTDTSTVQYRTKSGSFWLVGHEGAKLGLACFHVKKGVQRLTLPPRDRLKEREMRHERLIQPFSQMDTYGEAMGLTDYPSAPALN